jgi:non-ribosomal peptide synthetase component F
MVARLELADSPLRSHGGRATSWAVTRRPTLDVIRAQEPVGVLLAQGASAVPAILGVLKAGKIYVPLDPLFPEARLADARAWVGARLIATDSKSFPLARSVADRSGDVLIVDCLRDRGDDPRPVDLASPDDIAYVFFTSGSTGTPKGLRLAPERPSQHPALYQRAGDQRGRPADAPSVLRFQRLGFEPLRRSSKRGNDLPVRLCRRRAGRARPALAARTAHDVSTRCLRSSGASWRGRFTFRTCG